MAVLTQTNKQLPLTIAEQTVRLEQAFPSKNRGNSSLPPSLDMVPRTKSLRPPSGKKKGGPSGHAGSTLKFSPSSDFTEDIFPEAWVACGAAPPSILAAYPQVVDIPAVRPVSTQYNIF